MLRNLLLLALSLLLIAGQLNAQTVLCVDRDFGGDSTGDYTDTWPMISRALDAAGYTYEYWEVLEYEHNGPDAFYMGNFDVVIWFTGEAWTDGATMGPDDEWNLTLYQTTGGGKLFMNAQDYLYDLYPGLGTFNSGEFVYDQLGVVTVEQDVYHIEPEDPGSIGDSATFYGSPGSLAEGLQIPVHDIFTTPTDDGLYGDSIAVHNGQDLLAIQAPYMSPGPAAIQYETDYFRTVFTTIDIAAISDTVIRDILMHRIVDWLMYGATGINEINADKDELLIRPNPVSTMVNISMRSPIEEISIYSSQGQQVYHEVTNAIHVKADLSHLSTGIYVVKAKSGNNIITGKILKE